MQATIAFGVLVVQRPHRMDKGSTFTLVGIKIIMKKLSESSQQLEQDANGTFVQCLTHFLCHH